jgi:hypothetical protein
MLKNRHFILGKYRLKWDWAVQTTGFERVLSEFPPSELESHIEDTVWETIYYNETQLHSEPAHDHWETESQMGVGNSG